MIVSTIMLLLSIANTADIMAQRTTRRGLRVESHKENTTQIDTVAINPSSRKIIISGYDKPLKSSKETFFITNNTTNNILGLRVSLEYIDAKGRTLHKRDHHLNINIPVGETRQAAIKSWDVQRSFYYKLSSKPRKADATPYDVNYQIISIDIKSNVDKTN